MHILTSLRDIISFPAYLLRVHFIYQLRQKNIFITVGNDEDLVPAIRVWNFDKRNKDGTPSLARSIRAVIPGAKDPKQLCDVSLHVSDLGIILGWCWSEVLVPTHYGM